jgi:hypothetical protein
MNCSFCFMHLPCPAFLDQFNLQQKLTKAVQDCSRSKNWRAGRLYANTILLGYGQQQTPALNYLYPNPNTTT